MRKKSLLGEIGFFYLIFGVIILFNSFQGITGYAIFENTDVEWGGFLGVVFIIIGIVVWSAAVRDGRLENKLRVYNSHRGKNKDKS